MIVIPWLLLTINQDVHNNSTCTNNILWFQQPFHSMKIKFLKFRVTSKSINKLKFPHLNSV